MKLVIGKFSKVAVFIGVGVLTACPALAFNTDDPVTHLGPPAVSVVDRMGVLVTSGVVSSSVNDVMIGGQRGLTHSVSASGGKFTLDLPAYRGFQDSFFGTISGSEMTMNTSDLTDDFDVLVVSDGRETVRFTVEGTTGNYTYTDLRVKGSPSRTARHKLVQTSSTQMIWTKPGGVRVYYQTVNWINPTSAGTKAKMTSIEYPNGFKIHIDYGYPHQITSVSTNTGYQLKYIFEDDTRSLTSTQQAILNTTNYDSNYAFNTLNWSREVPKYVVALNNGVQTCSVTAASCNYDAHWPRATYVWPAGMPGVTHLPASVDFIVKDAENRETKYTLQGFDIAVEVSTYIHSSGWFKGILPGERTVSRITKLTPPSGKPTSYYYDDVFEDIPVPSGTFGVNGYVRHRILNKAVRGNEELIYSTDINNAQGDMVLYHSTGRKNLNNIYFNQATESINSVDNWDMDIQYTGGFVSDIASIDNRMGGNDYEYEYDSAGNVKKVIQKNGYTNGPTSQATYAGTCASSYSTYCGKQTSTTDPNGNTTNYTYHSQSGQIASVKLPPNKHGVRATTTYSYQQYTANHNGPYSSPIWLLSEKVTCATVANCSSADEIKTTYEYEPTNLQLVGEIISADGESLRTCYEYDDYGNQITVMPPKDNLNKTTCIN